MQKDLSNKCCVCRCSNSNIFPLSGKSGDGSSLGLPWFTSLFSNHEILRCPSISSISTRKRTGLPVGHLPHHPAVSAAPPQGLHLLWRSGCISIVWKKNHGFSYPSLIRRAFPWKPMGFYFLRSKIGSFLKMRLNTFNPKLRFIVHHIDMLSTCWRLS